MECGSRAEVCAILRTMFGLFRRLRRRRLANRPFPEAWFGFLDEHVGFYGRLPDRLQPVLLERLKVLVWEKNWEGADGLEITDEHKVVIAAVAARLVLALDLSYYDRIKSIVVYPGHYKHPDKDRNVVYGQVNQWGALVLSWQAVLQGLKDPTDGHDTTVHEFAHALDLADGAFDGMPPLADNASVKPWCEVMQFHFDDMQTRRRNHIIRNYGAQNPAEFFAVVSEVFFEQPALLKAKKPDLYAELRSFYGFDPISGEQPGLKRRRRPLRAERNRAKRARRER